MGKYSRVRRSSKRTPLNLTAKRKLLINKFKQTDMEQDGSAYWRLRLFNFMKEQDNRITLADVERWVASHLWFKSGHAGSYALRGQTLAEDETLLTPTTKTSEESPSQLRAVPNSVNAGEILTDWTPQDEGHVKNYFHLGFRAVAVLREICTEMPKLRDCLNPLKNIHHCFVRNCAKPIIPNGYREVRNVDPIIVNTKQNSNASQFEAAVKETASGDVSEAVVCKVMKVIPNIVGMAQQGSSALTCAALETSADPGISEATIYPLIVIDC